MSAETWEKGAGNPWALLPFGVFLSIFLGSGIIFGDFGAMPAIVAFLIALLVAFLQNHKLKFMDKMSVMAKGVGDVNILLMCLIFLCAGAFSGAVTAAGGVESTVNFGLSIMPAGLAVAGLFIISCFISISMGTSVGTIGALAPIAIGISVKTGLPAPLCVATVVGGAMFGDNLSIISDTTIAAVNTQRCGMRDKFRENFKIVLPAAVLTIIILLLITGSSDAVITEDLSYNIFKVLPYLLVLIGALVGINVFIVLIGGTVLSLIVGVTTGSIALNQMFTAVGNGIYGMYDITVISIVVVCILSLVKTNGGIQWVLDWIKQRIKSQKGAEFGIAGLAFGVDLCSANNTVTIVTAGPIAKEIADEYGVDAKRSASLLDIFSAAAQGLIPYGAQLLAAAGLTGLTPYMIMPYLFYPILMAVSALVFIQFRKRSPAKDKQV